MCTSTMKRQSISGSGSATIQRLVSMATVTRRDIRQRDAGGENDKTLFLSLSTTVTSTKTKTYVINREPQVALQGPL